MSLNSFTPEPIAIPRLTPRDITAITSLALDKFVPSIVRNVIQNHTVYFELVNGQTFKAVISEEIIQEQTPEWTGDEEVVKDPRRGIRS